MHMDFSISVEEIHRLLAVSTPTDLQAKSFSVPAREVGPVEVRNFAKGEIALAIPSDSRGTET